MKIKEKHKLSQFAVNNIIEDVTVLFQISSSNTFLIIASLLKGAGVHEDIISSISKLFDHDSEHVRPFKGLETQYLQHKYFKKNFGLVVSIYYKYRITYQGIRAVFKGAGGWAFPPLVSFSLPPSKYKV